MKPNDLYRIITVWPETTAVGFLLVVVLVLVLEFPLFSEDEDENEDDFKTRVSGQTVIRKTTIVPRQADTGWKHCATA